MIRIQAVFVLACTAFAANFALNSHAAADEVPICQLAAELRAALGFGPLELAALGIDGDTYNSINDAAVAECVENEESLAPLLEDFRDARTAVFRAYESFDHDAETPDDTAIDEAESQLSSAVAALSSACSQLVTTMTGLLPSESQADHAHMADNWGLDARCALLDLTAQQRSDLRTAQRTCDKVLKHHKLRKHLPHVTSAWSTFESDIAEVLTQAQESQFDQFESNLHEHADALLAIEEGLCGS